jgi:hypothetical protein
MKLKIFSDRNYLVPGMKPVPMLYPFWRDLVPQEADVWMRPHDAYLEVGQHLFEMTTLEDADYAVLPVDWASIRGNAWRAPIHETARDLAIAFAQQVQQAEKPLVLFFASDCSDDPLPIQNAIVFRQSAYRSKHEFSFPYFCEDYLQHYLNQQIPIRQKREKPVVGFYGFARPLSIKRALQIPIYYSYMLATQRRFGVSPYKGQVLRSKALNRLANHPGIETKFKTWDYAVFFDQSDPQHKKDSRLEYVQNIIDSDYIFCCRGAANYSNRFFEVLSCGRIPIFLDTDCKLPFDSRIDWKKYCIFIEEEDLPHIGEKVLEFHDRISPQDFIDLQYACRELWQTWLSSEGFYSQVQRLLYDLL